MEAMHQIVQLLNGFGDWINENPLIVGAVVIGLLLIWKIFYKSSRSIKDQMMRDFADDRGLDLVINESGLDPSPLKRTIEYDLTGHYHGVRIRVVAGLDKHYIEFGAPRRMNWYLEFYARIRGWPMEVQVGPEGLLSKLSKFVGESGVEIGHDEFDRKFVVRGPAQAAREALDSSVISSLLAFSALDYDFAIDNGHLIVYADPLDLEESILEQTLDRLTRTVRKIRAESPTF